MTISKRVSALTSAQRGLVTASFLGCALDAFDFFTLVFVARDIAQEFAVSVKVMTIAILLTIAMRPVGALFFQLVADRTGWRPTLLLVVLLLGGLEGASGLAPSLVIFLILRAAYGAAMGGEWRLGATFSMNTIPLHRRGVVRGLLQASYPIGYLVASAVLLILCSVVGWRGMFVIASLPAFLMLAIRYLVHHPAAAVEQPSRVQPRYVLGAIDGTLAMIVWAFVLMAALNFFGRGTDDVFPRFIEIERAGVGHPLVLVAAAYNFAAADTIPVVGALSDRIGSRRAGMIAALVELPIIPIWVYSVDPNWLATSALLLQYTIFSLQSKVRGAWFRSRLITR